ncbi:hypothetical protein SI859A1_03673 [Aurantimonas manganoxydans SI85-9A1]|uniref:Uncharacterized protein n=1 Tax=Aurantimonas manganoxydans (strain ATCC BAA-1229 / DSM 21871 / SI85-9A1) TaxID=287752 RepID=Q1YDH0_AURMS|nr:hypothetical protein SI859A1_03673 [Aurantimonas manganoxydans SI85-9A1]
MADYRLGSAVMARSPAVSVSAGHLTAASRKDSQFPHQLAHWRISRRSSQQRAVNRPTGQGRASPPHGPHPGAPDVEKRISEGHRRQSGPVDPGPGGGRRRRSDGSWCRPFGIREGCDPSRSQAPHSRKSASTRSASRGARPAPNRAGTCRSKYEPDRREDAFHWRDRHESPRHGLASSGRNPRGRPEARRAMIGGFTKFGGRSRDAQALIAHLAKTQPGGSSFEAMNSAAPTMAAVVAEARLAAAARGIGDRPFWHIHLSPSAAMSEAGLRQAVAVVCREMGVTDHPVGIEYHSKPRRHGGAEIHAHLVIGRAAWSGNLLAAGFEKIRLETACRVAEVEAGDTHVRGRHLAAGLRYLEKAGRHDVIASLNAAFGDESEPPRGSLSPEKRQALVRKGVDAVDLRAAVRAAWEGSDNGSAFAVGLAEHGLTLVRGEKRGVWTVRTGDTGIVLGAVDRLVGEKRKVIAYRLRHAETEAILSSRRPDPVQHEQDREVIGGGPDQSGRDPGELESLGGRRRRNGGESGHRPARNACRVDRSTVAAAGPDRGEAGATGTGPSRRRAAVAALTVARAVHVGRDRLVALRARVLSLLRQDQVHQSEMSAPLVPAMDPSREEDGHKSIDDRLAPHEQITVVDKDRQGPRLRY